MNNSLSLIDLSRPHFITQAAAKFYLPFYQQLLAARAAGRDIRDPLPVQAPEPGIMPKSVTMPKAVELYPGIYLPTGENDRYGNPEHYHWSFRDGVATVELIGPVVRYGGWLSAMSGLASTGLFVSQIYQAFDHPAVESIVAVIDSPGGDSNGIFEAAARIAMLRGQGKPLVAYVDGCAASAGYLLACPFEEIVTAPNALLGSIGCVYCLEDDTKKLEKEGIKEYIYVSSQSPKKWAKLGTDEADNEWQRLVDEGAELFGNAVAEYRDVPIKTVWQDFGQGGVLTGQYAVNVGMADRVGDYESLITQLSTGYKPWRSVENNGGNAKGASMLTGLNSNVKAALALLGVNLGADGGATTPPADAGAAGAAAPGAGATPPATTAPAASDPVPDPRDARIAELEARLSAQPDPAATTSAANAAATRATEVQSFMTIARTKVPAAQHGDIEALYANALEHLPGQAAAMKSAFEAMPVHQALQQVPTPAAPAAGVQVPNPDSGAPTPQAKVEATASRIVASAKGKPDGPVDRSLYMDGPAV